MHVRSEPSSVTAEGARPKRDRSAELILLMSLPAYCWDATYNAQQQQLLQEHDSFIAKPRDPSAKAKGPITLCDSAAHAFTVATSIAPATLAMTIMMSFRKRAATNSINRLSASREGYLPIHRVGLERVRISSTLNRSVLRHYGFHWLVAERAAGRVRGWTPLCDNSRMEQMFPLLVGVAHFGKSTNAGSGRPGNEDLRHDRKPHRWWRESGTREGH
jgi:hypothetical protein